MEDHLAKNKLTKPDAAPPTPPSASTYLRQESVSSVEETKLTLGRGSEDIVISNDNSMNGNYVNKDWDSIHVGMFEKNIYHPSYFLTTSVKRQFVELNTLIN